MVQIALDHIHATKFVVEQVQPILMQITTWQRVEHLVERFAFCFGSICPMNLWEWQANTLEYTVTFSRQTRHLPISSHSTFRFAPYSKRGVFLVLNRFVVRVKRLW